MRRAVGTGLYAGFLFVLLGAVAWATGEPFVFPSLGPSAFVLAMDWRSDRTRPSRVVGSHLLGGVAGLLAWTLLAAGVTVTAMPAARSLDGLRLAASATGSIVWTSWAMLATDTVHPPACATTLIVSLGILATPGRVAIVVGSVTMLVATHVGVRTAADRLLAGGRTPTVTGD